MFLIISNTADQSDCPLIMITEIQDTVPFRVIIHKCQVAFLKRLIGNVRDGPLIYNMVISYFDSIHTHNGKVFTASRISSTNIDGGFMPSHTANVNRTYWESDSHGFMTGTCDSSKPGTGVNRIFMIFLPKA